jgi:hypothetical protein
MALFRPTYTDKKTGKLKESAVWWYEFYFAGKRIRECTKSKRKTVATEAERNRRLELERGYNAIEDRRQERIRSVAELAKEYLNAYKLRHKSFTFAEYALGHVTRHVGTTLAISFNEQTVRDYQTARLKEKASAKSINEEVGFLLRLLAERGDEVRGKLRRQRGLKLKVSNGIGKAFDASQTMPSIMAARQAALFQKHRGCGREVSDGGHRRRSRPSW